MFDDVTRDFSDTTLSFLNPYDTTSPFTTASMALSPGSLDIVLKADPVSRTSTVVLVAGLNDLTPLPAIGIPRTQTIEVSGNAYYNGEIHIMGSKYPQARRCRNRTR